MRSLILKENSVGDYTKLTMRARLAAHCAKEVQQALDAAMSGLAKEVPTHEFFQCARWKMLLCQSRLVVADEGPVFEIEGNVKNHDHEIR